jgi:succinyl-diaminopimelate desuccinylase
MLDPIALTQQLIQIDSQNPPGQEGSLAEFIGNVLTPLGFSVHYQPIDSARKNLIAKLGTGPGILLAGHLDTRLHGGRRSGFYRSPQIS